jgi:hypothetical protein
MLGGNPLGDMRTWVMTHHRAWLMLQRRHAEREQTDVAMEMDRQT